MEGRKEDSQQVSQISLENLCLKDRSHYLFIYLKNLFINFLPCWVFVSVQGPSPVVASGGHSSSRCAGLSLSWPLVAEHGSHFLKRRKIRFN